MDKKMNDDFKDILRFSELSLKEVWDNEEDLYIEKGDFAGD